PHLEQVAGVRVPEVMPANGRDAGSDDAPAELLRLLGRVERPAIDGGEDETLIGIAWSHGKADGGLGGEMAAQDADRLRVEVEPRLAVVGLDVLHEPDAVDPMRRSSSVRRLRSWCQHRRSCRQAVCALQWVHGHHCGRRSAEIAAGYPGEDSAQRRHRKAQEKY